MARYSDAHKQATRQRIVETAGRRLKSDGIDGSGVATLMKDAGLTNGAFYGHFASKDDLVATSISDQLRQQQDYLRALEPGMEGLEHFVREYLSVGHRDDRADGCPTAALLDEIGRCSGATQQAYTDGIVAIIDDIATRLGHDDVLSARRTMFSVFALMVGSLQLSRAIADPVLADAVLEQGRLDALTLLRAAETTE